MFQRWFDGMSGGALPISAAVVVALAIVVAALVGVWANIRRRKARNGARTIAGGRDSPNVTLAAGMQSYADLEREYLRRKATYDDRCLAIARRLDDLQQRSWERVGPADVLNHALPQEIAGMRSITKCEESAIVNAIIDAIRKAGSNTTASAGRKLMGRDPYVSYREVLDDAAKKLKVEGITANSSDSAVETALTATAFKAAWEKATPIEREALAKHLSASDRKTLYTMGATGTALAGAGAVGFPLYIAASTVVGSLTSAIGVTLPFAAYTTMSSGIALVIGPAGWLALIGVAAWKIGGVNYAVTIPAVTAIAAVRGRLIAERDQEIAGLEAERQGELQVIGGQLATLKTLLDRMRVEGLRSVPRESISL